MNIIRRKLHTMLHTPRIFMKKFEGSSLFKYLPDEIALKIQFKNRFLRNLDLEDPKTFNEKLQWLKLYNRRPEYIKMVDKYEVKKYVASLIGEEYIIPTYGVWDSFDEIDLNSLPKQFVLKCTHGSGDAIIVKDKDKLDVSAARIKLTKSLNTNYYHISREWPYKNVKPRILAEEYKVDESGMEIKDYKVMCFDGKPMLIQVHQGRFVSHVQDFYRPDWKKLNIEQGCPMSDNFLAEPISLKRMLELSSRLSASVPHLRVDWYDVNGQLFFGELTFFDGSGFEKFTQEEWDYTIGAWITLPNKHR